MPLYALVSGGFLVRSSPSYIMEADEVGNEPIMDFRRVVLPTPFLPIKQVQDPAKTFKSTSQSVWLSP